jgi:hypothetical protein
VEKFASVIHISFSAHSINDDIIRHVVGLTPLGAHEVDELNGLLVASRPARRLEEDVVGDHVGRAPAAEHVVEHRERVPDPPPVAERVDKRVEGIRDGLHPRGYAVHDAARVLEQACAAVPIGERAVSYRGGCRPARLNDARGIGGAPSAAEVADEPVGEGHVGRARGRAHEAERRV